MGEKLSENELLNAGVTPLELFLRQQGLCYLVIKTDSDGGAVHLFCTDGEDTARADFLANPTVECARCMSRFILRRLGLEEQACAGKSRM